MIKYNYKLPQNSVHLVLIFRLLLKITVNWIHLREMNHFLQGARTQLLLIKRIDINIIEIYILMQT